MVQLLNGDLTKSKKKMLREAINYGKSLKEITNMFDLEENYARSLYKDILLEILADRPRRIGMKCEIYFGGKISAYYENEDDYGKIPQYKWEDLAQNEIYFHKLIQKKEKMDKLKRFKIDVLLHMNASLMANLGTDSSKEEIRWVRLMQRENLKRIKDIDLDFYKTIDDGENKAKNYY
jgi:hypothetical protein|tara:strand:+ start:63 stop:596 length:534 start_codon:yes stop_codon:yes gene_type:complete